MKHRRQQRAVLDVLLYLALFWSISLLGLPWLLSGKASASAGEAGDAGSIPGSGRSLKKEMAARSSILAWRILWTEEPGGLQSTGPQRVGHDSETKQQGYEFQASEVTAFHGVKNANRFCESQGVPVVEGKNSGIRLLVLPPTSCVTLSQLLNLSEPQPPCPRSGIKTAPAS